MSDWTGSFENEALSHTKMTAQTLIHYEVKGTCIRTGTALGKAMMPGDTLNFATDPSTQDGFTEVDEAAIRTRAYLMSLEPILDKIMATKKMTTTITVIEDLDVPRGE